MDSTITLLVVNIIVIILFAVVLVFVIYTYQQNVNLIKKQREDINKLVLYIRYFDSVLINIIQSVQDNSASIEQINQYTAKIKNITDLDEFKNLSPELKAKYKKYVVDQTMVSFAELANNNIVTDEQFQSFISNITNDESSN
jgi:type II secretory pathway pseudopilin PulG